MLTETQVKELVATISSAVIHQQYAQGLDSLKSFYTNNLQGKEQNVQAAEVSQLINTIRNQYGYVGIRAARAGVTLGDAINRLRSGSQDPAKQLEHHQLGFFLSLGHAILDGQGGDVNKVLGILRSEFSIARVGSRLQFAAG